MLSAHTHPDAFRKRWILPRSKNMPPACFLNGLSNPITPRKNLEPTEVDSRLLCDSDTIDAVHKIQTRPPIFCKNRIFRSQVSTDAQNRSSGDTSFKVYHTNLKNTSNYLEGFSTLSIQQFTEVLLRSCIRNFELAPLFRGTAGPF